MHTSAKVALLASFTLASSAILLSIGYAAAEERVTITKSERGGIVAATDRHRFEVFFYPTGIRVFTRDQAGQPISTAKLLGSATFYHPNSPKPWFSRPLRAGTESLDLSIGLGSVPPSGVRVAFEVSGLPGVDKGSVTFTVPLEFVAEPTAQPVAPVTASGTSPRYVYAPGYYGYGYYSYPGPETVPQAAATQPSYYGTARTYGNPGSHFSGDGDSVGAGHRDWSSGRDSSLAKPWLRPRD